VSALHKNLVLNEVNCGVNFLIPRAESAQFYGAFRFRSLLFQMSIVKLLGVIKMHYETQYGACY